MVMEFLLASIIGTGVAFRKELSGKTDIPAPRFTIEGESMKGRSTERTGRQKELLDQYEKALGAGDYEQALSFIERAIKLDPCYPVYYVLLCSCYLNLEQYDKALASIDKALDCDGKVYVLSDSFRNGIVTVRAQVENIVTKSKLLNKFQSAGKAGHYEEALSYASKLIRLEPHVGTNYFYRGVCKVFIGDDVGAIKDYKSALRYGPSSDMPLNVTGEINALYEIKRKWERELHCQRSLIKKKIPNVEKSKICILCGASSTLKTVERKTVCAKCFKEWWGKRSRRVKARAQEEYLKEGGSLPKS